MSAAAPTSRSASTSWDHSIEATGRHHEVEADQARAAGLEIVQCRNERLQLEFFDVGAMVFFLRKVVWTVPDFTVDRYRARLQELHEEIERTACSVPRCLGRSSRLGNQRLHTLALDMSL